MIALSYTKLYTIRQESMEEEKKRHKQRGEPRKQFSPIIEISKQ
jgi:hypothetical protein